MIGFGFTTYKFFQDLPEEIAAGNIPESAGTAQSEADPDCSWYCGISGRSFATS